MQVAVTDLMGVSSIPASKPACIAWLRRSQIALITDRNRFLVQLSDLPADVRLAYLAKHIDGLDLDPGTYDDGAHDVFMQASAERRARAEAKAEVALFLVALGPSVPWADKLALVHKKFGKKGYSKPNLMALLRQVKGVDPINFAPALLDRYETDRPRMEIHPDAWRCFMTAISKAAPEWPLKAAWRDVRDIAPKASWGKVPCYVTFVRRWNALTEAQRLEARYGAPEARKRLVQPIIRDKTSIQPLEWVSLDGRTKDFWVDAGDGRAVRQTFLALVDIASNFILGWDLVASENATDTVRLIKKTCETYGIFDRLYTDNGSAFAGHLVSGGNMFRFRNGGKAVEGIQPPGICKTMGIKIHFALPSGPDHSGGKAKIAERVFATLSRSVDDRPEFSGAHTGHKPGASPTKDVMPIQRDEALRILTREVRRYNTETGRRGQGMNGTSYEQVFRDGLAERVIRTPTARQLYLAGLIYKPVSVDRDGRVKVHGWTYGGASTQEALLRYHGTGKKVLLGRDPDDFEAPALAFDEEGNLICEGIEPVKAGRYGSVHGIKEADRNRKAARAAVKAGKEANDYLADVEFAKVMALLDAPEPKEFTGAKGVVKGHFKSPVKATKRTKPTGGGGAIPLEYMDNLNAALARKGGGGGKSA